MEQQQPVTELTSLLRKWEEESAVNGYDPIPTLTRLSELFESESKNYIKKDPDPFDDRHPSRIDPTCALGQMYKILFRKDELMTALVTRYISYNHWPRRIKDNYDLNVSACRLIINLIPGLEASVVFESDSNESLVSRLFSWAENGPEPMQTYATALLGAAMELPDIAANFKDDNNTLVPIVLDRIHLFYKMLCDEIEFANSSTKPLSDPNISNDQPKIDLTSMLCDNSQKLVRSKSLSSLTDYNSDNTTQCGVIQSVEMTSDDEPNNTACDDSNSSCIMVESNSSNWVQVYPVTLTTKLVYCFKYLIPTGEYQVFLSHAYEKNSLSLVMKIISATEKLNGYLAFEALKYLSALLCHKKFATEFIGSQGLQKLLLIPRPSMASTGLSICFYYLSYCEEAMERICLLPEHVLVDLVKYALWMLECSHDSSRCHATMFFSHSFHFRVIQDIFDNYDGLRKLVNVISTLPILSSDDPSYNGVTEEAECSARQIIRHVCAGLKHYFEAHLHTKAQQIRRAKMRDSGLLMTSSIVHNFSTVPGYKSSKKSQAEVYEEIELLLNAVSMKSHWTPVDQLIKLGGLNLLLQIINLAHEWNFSGRCEMIKNALEVINICAVLPKVQLLLCEPTSSILGNHIDVSILLDRQAQNDNVGLNIIIKAAEGDLLDTEIQKAALSVIITCVCAPIHREGGSIAYYSAHGSAKKRMHKTNDDGVIEKIWDCIRNNNGIMVLLTLMTLKTPITDVDAIRGLASRALAGLARSESVRQIISKLPLFNSGQLQSLVKNPVLQEKRQEHVTFQKYALELMELVTGKTKHNGAEIEASLANINRANIVAQTKINFNEQQLLLLMHQHLISKGLSNTAEKLVQEANLNITEKKSAPFTYVAHCRNRSVGGGMSSTPSRYSIQNQKSELASSSNGVLSASYNARGVNSSSPIRLNVNKRTETRPKSELEPEIESPMSKLVHKKIDQDVPLSSDNNSNSTVSLESIITEYLTNQHASCKHPMVTCPTFNLFVPHKCPDPKPRSAMCTNFAMRFSKNMHSKRLNQRLIHSRFCPISMFIVEDEDDLLPYYTCCEFLNQNRIAVGMDGGEIKVFNLFTSQEELSFTAHDTYVSNIECSNNERLMLSSASWRGPVSSLWALKNDSITLEFSMNLEEYCTFSNYDQNKMLGTRNETATIYDVETCKKLLTLVPRHSNRYNRNRAVFDATNELVLSDGVLWDATAGKEIHKFDKLNQCISGVFHPNGLEIISNTEVWDMRTFQLLRTVSSLNQCDVVFSRSGEGMYLFVIDQDTDNDTSHQTSFKTLDPLDYSNIATVDVKKFIYHMACNSSDTQIAIVENLGTYDNIDESIVRVYDVGRTRNEDETVDEDDEEDEDVDSGGSASTDDENMSLFPSFLEDMLAEGYNRGDHFSSGSSSSSSSSSSSHVSSVRHGSRSRVLTPLSSDSSNDASYDASYEPEDE